MDRKRKKGTKRTKLVEQAEARAKAKEEKAARLVIIRAERGKREEKTIASLKIRQVSQLLNHHRQRFRKGEHPFWHCTVDGKYVHNLRVPTRLAWELRSGAMAIVVMGDLTHSEPEYVVVSREIARKVQDTEPNRIVFLNENPPDKDDPSERLAGTD
jgi:uncharacterized protein YaiL (DUF2058 family)